MVLILFLYHCVPFDADIFSHQRRFVKAFCALKTEQREERQLEKPFTLLTIRMVKPSTY